MNVLKASSWQHAASMVQSWWRQIPTTAPWRLQGAMVGSKRHKDATKPPSRRHGAKMAGQTRHRGITAHPCCHHGGGQKALWSRHGVAMEVPQRRHGISIAISCRLHGDTTECPESRWSRHGSCFKPSMAPRRNCAKTRVR